MKTKLIFLILLIICSVSMLNSCQAKLTKDELAKFKATTIIQDNNKEIVREILSSIDSGDSIKLGNLLSDDFLLYVSATLQPYKKEDLIKARNAHYEAFPDWNHKIEDLIAEGDMVVVKLTQYGTHKAKFNGIEPTGKYVSVPAIHIIKIVNGKGTEWWGIEDNLGMMTQLD